MRTLLIALTIAAITAVNALAANTMEDSFAVRKLEKDTATLSGTVKTLKAGDSLYFPRPPYEFKVVSVDSELDEVVVALPSKHDLASGNALLRHPTERIKKFLATESRLKEALSE